MEEKGLSWLLHGTLGPLYSGMKNPWIWRAHCTMLFYIRDLNSHRFWYPQAPLNQSPQGYRGTTVYFFVIRFVTMGVHCFCVLKGKANILLFSKINRHVKIFSKNGY